MAPHSILQIVADRMPDRDGSPSEDGCGFICGAESDLRLLRTASPNATGRLQRIFVVAATGDVSVALRPISQIVADRVPERDGSPSSDSISLKKVICFFICRFSRPDPIYNYFGGRQRHLLLRLEGLDLQEDPWRQS